MDIFIDIGVFVTAALYKVASWLFRIFVALAGKQLVSDDSYQTFISNSYIIVGLVVLFVIAFALLKGMVNPDDSKGGTSQAKKIVTNLVTSIIILTLVPVGFDFAYDVQDAVINNNTIGGFFGFGGVGNADSGNDTLYMAANKIVNGVWTAFFNADEEWCQSKGYESLDECQQNIETDDDFYVDGEKIKGNFKNLVNIVDQRGTFNLYMKASGAVKDDQVSFYFLLTFAGGIYLIYIAFVYTLSLAKRMVKLFFYQLIAPLPILLRILPNGSLSGMFNKWLKVTLTCFFEVFLRLFILYFSVFACSEIRQTHFFDTYADAPKATETLPYEDNNVAEINSDNKTLAYVGFGDENLNKKGIKNIITIADNDDSTNNSNDDLNSTNASTSNGDHWFLDLITKAFLYMGVLMFMKSAPKVISEVTGINSDNMKLGLKDQLAESGLLTAGAVIGSGITSGVQNWTNTREQDPKTKKWHRKQDVSRGEQFRSVVAGTISGAAHGGWNARNAKSTGDMKTAISNAVKTATTARDDRAAYKARHGGTLGGAMQGHLEDLGFDIGRWAGINNVSSLEAALKLFEQTKKENKAIDSEVRDTIIGDMNKNKSKSYGIKGNYTYVDENGNQVSVAYNTQELRKISQKMEAAKNAGDQKLFTQLQNTYDAFLKDFADKVSNQALLGDTAWEALGKDARVDLAKVRQAADKYRETLSRNLNAAFMSGFKDANGNDITAQVINDIVDRTKSLDVSGSAMKDVKDNIDLLMTEYTRKINEVRQKEAERDKSKK